MLTSSTRCHLLTWRAYCNLYSAKENPETKRNCSEIHLFSIPASSCTQGCGGLLESVQVEGRVTTWKSCQFVAGPHGDKLLALTAAVNLEFLLSNSTFMRVFGLCEEQDSPKSPTQRRGEHDNSTLKGSSPRIKHLNFLLWGGNANYCTTNSEMKSFCLGFFFPLMMKRHIFGKYMFNLMTRKQD